MKTKLVCLIGVVLVCNVLGRPTPPPSVSNSGRELANWRWRHRHPSPTPSPSPTATASATATPTATATASATSTATPKPSATTTPATTQLRGIGLVRLLQRVPNDNEYKDDVTKTVMLRVTWSEIQTGPTTYDWPKIDHALDMAKQNGKQLALTVGMLGVTEEAKAPPDWLDVKLWPVRADTKTESIMVPWDPVGEPAMLEFQKQLYLRYDGQLVYIALGGIGVTVESYICDDPAKVGETLTSGLAKWTGSCHAIIDTAGQYLHQTSFLFSQGVPFKGGKVVQDALTAVVVYGMEKYPNFGAMNCNLNAHSDTTYFINKTVSDYALTHPCGMEFLTSGKGFNGHDLGGTVLQTLEAGITILHGRGFIHVYAADVDDPANATMLKAEAAKLK